MWEKEKLCSIIMKLSVLYIQKVCWLPISVFKQYVDLAEILPCQWKQLKDPQTNLKEKC